MSFVKEIKDTIGDEIYSTLDKCASSAFSKDFHSNPHLGQKSHIEFLLIRLTKECEIFERYGFKISPIDVINILYKCKLIKSSKTEEEYRNKTIRYNLVDEFDFYIPWSEKEKQIETLIEEYFERLKASLKENTLTTEINSFKGDNHSIQSFFENLFSTLNFSFKAYINKDLTKERVTMPSIGYSVFGSLCYSRWYANAWLKSFMSLLKIAGFVHPSQINFGWDIAEQQSACYPVFLGTGNSGCFIWNEDTKDALVKIPDGCLSHSFGNRSITNMWFDFKSIRKIREFILDNRLILESHRNPWSMDVQKNITPILDILSSAIQSTDIAAKILLIYCCLEHLFVPLGTTSNNRYYIEKGIDDLDSQKLDWFKKLYKYRCSYAHKGYIKRDDNTIDFISQSITNTLLLLRIKLTRQ